MTFPRRYSFWLKANLTIAMIALADWLLYRGAGPGAALGVLLLALVGALLIVRPALSRNRLSVAGLSVAGLMAASQIETPSFLAFVLFAVAIGVATLAPRAGPFEDLWRWWQRLAMAALKALWAPVSDTRRLLAARTRTRTLKIATVLLTAALPVLGGAVFLALFAVANPVIDDALSELSAPEVDLGRVIFWGVVALPVWTVMRPRGQRGFIKLRESGGDLNFAGVSTASILLSLVVFNALFAVQNALDIAFLWSGALPPGKVTLADYAHRGAYPLIATALLAGLFVLVFLRPGSPMARTRSVRWLVTAWVAQNLFLVASCIWRTIDYVEAYSLTRFRIAALLWMVLVGLGLALVLWRLLRNRSASWLINANGLAAGIVLLACCALDLGGVAAAWNVGHAREVGGGGVELDVCYLHDLGDSAAVSLARVERRTLPPALQGRVVWTRRLLTSELAQKQADWRTWTWRNARRLAQVRALVGLDPADPPKRWERSCDGSPPPPPQPQQLTPSVQPGS